MNGTYELDSSRPGRVIGWRKRRQTGWMHHVWTMVAMVEVYQKATILDRRHSSEITSLINEMIEETDGKVS